MSDYLTNTRRSYDKAATDYATWIAGELATKPFDRAVLTTFAELVRGPVADVGCGTGRITAYLRDLGVDVFGVDLSRRMLAAAPGLSFAQASMTALPVRDGSLAGIVAWYSTIHIPDSDLPLVLAEFHRTLAPGGYLQLAFQVGDDVEHRTKAGNHEVALDFHHRTPARLAELLAAAGLPVKATLERAPDEEGAYAEDTPQAYVLSRKPQRR